MKTQADAEALAREMVEIGRQVGRRTVALITDMDRPLGRAVGNALEIIEVCETLRGQGPADLTAMCLELAANMIYLGEKAGTIEAARAMAQDAVESGAAFQKLCEMIEAQGGDSAYLRDTARFRLSPVQRIVRAPQSGCIVRADAEQIGRASVLLGAGRETKESAIDFGAGIVLHKKQGRPRGGGRGDRHAVRGQRGEVRRGGEAPACGVHVRRRAAGRTAADPRKNRIKKDTRLLQEKRVSENI